MRLTRISTRTGDNGSTGLADGTRVAKNHPRIAVLGSVDELNSQLGVMLAESLPDDVHKGLLQIQNDLFDLGGALASPSQDYFAEAKVAKLDEHLTHYNAALPALREFVLPGGCRAAAICHVARCVARRAEREMYALSQTEAVPVFALRYLNRLSDLLFVLSRHINHTQHQPEHLWSPSAKI
jgi:cob(I)alamin adenosyltransferase